MSGTLLGALALFVLTPAASAQEPDSPFVIRAVRAAAPPTIDGVVVEGEWAGAAIAEDFIQFEPHLGEPSGVFSQALVMYDSTALYVAFRLYDPEPPTAQLTRRDADLMNDDAAVILLDSHHDRRSGYFFVTNAPGTQLDGQIRDDGRTVDATWDASWSTAAQVADSGWTAEFAIPFVSMSYTAGDDVTWGINLGRSRRRTLEISYWAGPLDNEARVSQAGSIVGLKVAPPLRRYRLIPYGLSRVEQGEGELDYTADWQVGLDARYAVTPEMAAFLTANPDFAIIEADQERVNLTRFELQLEEKRPFFLESAQQFRQRIRTFYTRRISDVRVGGRVLGKQGPWNLTGIATWSEVDTGPPQPGAPELEMPKGAYAIARAQRDVLGSSNVALTVANRTLEGDNQGSLGADATLFFTRTLGMTAQLAKSWGPFGNGTWAYFIRPAYDSPTGHFHIRYTDLGDRFADNVNVIGFIRDDDRRELDSALERTFWIRRGAFERIEYSSNYNIYWSQQGILRSWQIDQGLEVELRSLWSLELDYQEEFKRYEKDFRNRQLGVELGYNTRQFQSARAGFRAGRNFDSDFQLWTASAAVKPTPRLSLEYELERLVLDPDPEGESTWIHVVRADQFFTPDLYLKVFFQANSTIERENIQAVFVYRYRPPFGTVQLAYQRGTAEFGERSQQGNTLFFKVTAVF